jgi:hypothetical protein
MAILFLVEEMQSAENKKRAGDFGIQCHGKGQIEENI